MAGFIPMIRRRKAFTLIELLVVVAIIAILAAIAVPNLLDAQVRSRVSKAKSEMSAVRLALEAYIVDHNNYPHVATDRWALWHPSLLDIPVITTPVAYLQSLPSDPFPLYDHHRYYGGLPIPRGDYYRYYRVRSWVDFYPKVDELQLKWILMSNGPDFDLEVHDDAGARDFLEARTYMFYDPTNGTVSSGDIIETNLRHGD
jgi:type II secretion system protein G